jgi:hypothetical protein
VNQSEKINFTVIERVSAAIGLAIAVLGLINWAMWHQTFFGLSQKQTAMASFMPLILMIYFVAPTDRLRRARDE